VTEGLSRHDLVAFVSASDASRARTFYQGSLRLQLITESPFALEFDANGTMLRVTLVDRVVPAPYTVLGWAVPDIDAAVRDLMGRGVQFIRYEELDQDQLAVWRAPSGARIAWFKDPEGNTLSLTEF
jgi:predicted enzyme related to lactoylglutathione lyase